MLTPAAPAKTDTSLWALPFSPTDWALTPLAVQAHVQRLQQRVHQLEQQVETLQGRVEAPRKPPASHRRRIPCFTNPRASPVPLVAHAGRVRAIRATVPCCCALRRSA